MNYAGGKCVFVDTDEANGFTFTADDIAPQITNKSKLLIINSPCNPSGGVLSREDFEKIYHLAVKRGVQLMTDECYCRFLYDSEPFSIAAMPGAKENVVVAGSLSKTYAMTGWRVGFALAPKPLIDAMMKLQSHTTSNPTSIAQKAAIEALRGPQDSIPIMLAEYRKRRDFVVSACAPFRASRSPNRAERFTPIRTSLWVSATALRRPCSFRRSFYPKLTWPWCQARRSEPTNTCGFPTPHR